MMDAGSKQKLNDAMRALRLGHHEALRQVYALTASRIYGKLTALLKTPDEATQALSATYLRLWKNHPSIPADGCDYLHFIAAIAHQSAVELRFSDRSNGELFKRLPNARNDSAVEMSALATSNEADRDMLTAAYLHFESIEQIADRTGVPADDVRRRLAELTRGERGGPQ